MAEEIYQSTAAKALRVNLDTERYGAFAEIGAGQEVARHFFQAGKASQTIAKSMSAYDMTYSDEIYGKEKNGRYVCESRLLKMLEKEYSLLIRRLSEKRADNSCFFALANTVATGEASRCHGWMGVRFQTKPHGEFNDIVLHVRMNDKHRLQQQESLGILGVNLVEAAFYGLKEPDKFIQRIVENLKRGSVVIDILRFSGPDLKKTFDNRTQNLELIRIGLAEAVMFSPEGDILHIPDTLYGKSFVSERGTFRPLTTTHIDVLEKGAEQLEGELKEAKLKNEVLSALEVVMPKETKADQLKDYSQRIDMIGAAGKNTLITNFTLYYQLKSFIHKCTMAPMGIVVTASMLAGLLDDSHYKDLEGGLLEGLGKMFSDGTKLYVYPHKTDKTCMTAKTFNPEGAAADIYHYYLSKKQITDIAACDEAANYWHSEDVNKLIKKGDNSWQKMVPPKALATIKEIFKAK